ncbi:hypothetical protein TELCIR_10154 [Teladorsagia circumcincta]|uniref:Uncharacterized protein n=1 Tax=Teladorsagia circumcincta TaxID=45464 RepID=A0A2G9UCV7_TELCI|nr:hypothetical protein TELCIR_10154 [Teladorsagia circumcincta]
MLVSLRNDDSLYDISALETLIMEQEHPSVSSGVAAGVTIGIFFIVFLFTFGCRIYSQYADRSQTQNSQTQETGLSESLAEDMWICGVPQGPPPPYEPVAKSGKLGAREDETVPERIVGSETTEKKPTHFEKTKYTIGFNPQYTIQ